MEMQCKTFVNVKNGKEKLTALEKKHKGEIATLNNCLKYISINELT